MTLDFIHPSLSPSRLITPLRPRIVSKVRLTALRQSRDRHRRLAQSLRVKAGNYGVLNWCARSEMREGPAPESHLSGEFLNVKNQGLCKRL